MFTVFIFNLFSYKIHLILRYLEELKWAIEETIKPDL